MAVGANVPNPPESRFLNYENGLKTLQRCH